MGLPDVRNIGFFHFGCADQSDPLTSLGASLEIERDQRELGDCLIVTPEAFNIRNGYWKPKDDRQPDLSIAERLRKLSSDFGVALVAGLIEEGVGGKPGYSSARLIDGNDCS